MTRWTELGRVLIRQADSKVWEAVKWLQAHVGNMTAEQIAHVETLVEQVILARNRVIKSRRQGD